MRTTIVLVACLIVIQMSVGALSADASGPTCYTGSSCPVYIPIGGATYPWCSGGYSQTYYPAKVNRTGCYSQYSYCTYAGYCIYPPVPYWWEYPYTSGRCNPAW